MPKLKSPHSAYDPKRVNFQASGTHGFKVSAQAFIPNPRIFGPGQGRNPLVTLRNQMFYSLGESVWVIHFH